MEKNIDIIAFFSAENFFKVKSVEKQTEKFYALNQEFTAEFPDCHQDPETVLNMLLSYQEERREEKARKDKKRLKDQHEKPLFSGVDTADSHISKLPEGKYILTAAQNNTAIDTTFFNSLVQYAALNSAQLLIAKMPYNKDAYQQPLFHEELWYDNNLLPYLVDDQIQLGKNFSFIAQANVLPTAIHPLTGFQNITGAGINTIIPASKIALKMVPALKNGKPKALLATGCCTLRNYILKRAGTVAAASHSIGAVFIDTEKGIFRHLEQMQGYSHFYDLDYKYMPTGRCNPDYRHISCFQPGDIHAEKISSKVLTDLCELIATYQPEHLILHDLLDFSSRNHHRRKDCLFNHLQQVQGNTVDNDLRLMAGVLDELYHDSMMIHVIESNHDLALERWVKHEHDFRLDPENAIVYLKCALAAYEHQQEHQTGDFNMLEYAYKEIGGGVLDESSLTFHVTDESLIIASIEHGCHGHIGISGTRGSPQALTQLGIPLNTGHTHSPAINGKVYTAGCCELEQGYNEGASGWAIAHIITYKNGQRQIIFG